MTSFFTIPSSSKKQSAAKRKRSSTQESSRKRRSTPKSGSKDKVSSRTNRRQNEAEDEEHEFSSAGSDSESEGVRNDSDQEESEEDETAAARRLRLAEKYLQRAKEEVDEFAGGFDAAEVDRDILADRLREDVGELKGKIYRKALPLDWRQARHALFRWDSTITSVAIGAVPFAYGVSKGGHVLKLRLQEPQEDRKSKDKKKAKKMAPPKTRPDLVCMRKSLPGQGNEKTFQGHTSPLLLAVQATADGKLVVTGGLDRRIVVHRAEDLEPIKAFKQHRDGITALAFRRNTNQCFSASKDRTVKVFSLDELAYIETLFGHQDEIADVDALAGERCVSVGCRDKTARYWKVPEESQLVFRGGTVEKKPPTHLDPLSLAREGSIDRVTLLDDDTFVTGSDNGQLALWFTSKKKPVFIFPRAHGLEAPLNMSDVSADDGADPKMIPAPQPRPITALRALPYSSFFLSGSTEGFIKIWRLSTDNRKIEALGTLGGESNGPQVRGIINDMAIAERDKDRVVVVAAVGREMRLGRWLAVKGARPGVMVFEVPRLLRSEVNGHTRSSPEEVEAAPEG